MAATVEGREHLLQQRPQLKQMHQLNQRPPQQRPPLTVTQKGR
jgi:hypothetical protein